MGRWDNEKQTQAAARAAGKKGERINPKKSRANLCKVCHVHPCDMDVHNTTQQRKDDNLVARHGGIGGAAASKKKTTPKLSKAKYIQTLKAKGLSDKDIKKSLKAAGYPTSLLGKY